MKQVHRIGSTSSLRAFEPSSLQRTLHKAVVKSDIQQPIGWRSFHHSFATYLQEADDDICTI